MLLSTDTVARFYNLLVNSLTIHNILGTERSAENSTGPKLPDLTRDVWGVNDCVSFLLNGNFFGKMRILCFQHYQPT